MSTHKALSAVAFMIAQYEASNVRVDIRSQIREYNMARCDVDKKVALHE